MAFDYLLLRSNCSMFSSKAHLKKRTPENGTDRESFLSLLVDEYLNTTSFDAKCQVLANLANFAYDPVNYGFIRDVGVLDIFLHVLKNETNTTLLHYASAGVCNLCIDPVNADYITKHTSLDVFTALLKSDCTEIVADVITTLIYLHSQQTKIMITLPEIVKIVQDLKDSPDSKLRNLATIFLQDVHGVPSV